MLIQSVTLENVKSYALETVEFSPGANAIVGHNGSGKTTILEAIGFVLFDCLPYSRANFVREGHGTARITLEFLSGYDERAYRVRRTIGGGDLYSVVDSELAVNVCEGRADAVQFLREHLGLDEETDPKELFRNAVGVPQGSFAASFLAAPAARKAVFDPFIRVAEYRQAFERLREPLNLLSRRQHAHEVEIGRLEGEVTRLAAAEAEAGGLSRRVQDREAQLRTAQEGLAAAESALREMEGQRERIAALRGLAQKRQQTVAELEVGLAAARQRVRESEEAEAATRANRAGHAAFRAALEAQAALNRRRARLHELQAQWAAVETRVAQLEAGEEAQRRALAEIEAAGERAAFLVDAAARQEGLEKELREAQRRADRLHDANERVRREQAAVDAARAEKARLQTEVAQAREMETSLEPARARLDTVQERWVTQRAREARLLEEKATVEEQGQRLRSSEGSAVCPICEQPLSEAHRSRHLATLRIRWRELDAGAREALRSVRQAETDREEARSSLARIENRLRSLARQEAVETVEAGLAGLHEQLTRYRSEAGALAQAPRRVSQLRKALEELGNPRRERDAALHQTERRGKVKEELQRLQAQSEGKRAARAELDERLAAFAQVEAEAADIASRLERFQQADGLYRRNQAAAEALSERRDGAGESERGLQAAQGEYARVREELVESLHGFDEDRFQEASDQVARIRGRGVRLESELGHLRGRLREVEKEAARLRLLDRRLAAVRSLRDGLAGQEELLRFLRSVLREAGPHVTKALVQQISYTANQMFGQIMEEYACTLHWREDYGIVLEVDGQERVFSQLSGGEQMSAALAVRLALLQEVSEIAIAFFDEPTSNLDDVRREALARQIVGVRGFQQIFIISHDDTFEQATERLIRVDKKGGASEISYG